MAAHASQTPATSSVRVHWVRGVKSPNQRRPSVSATAGKPPSNASQKTRRSCLGLEAMPFEPAVQRAAREAERLGRLTDIARRACERLLNQHALDLFQTHLVERAGAIPATAQPKVARLDASALRHEHSSLDRVIELPHITGPRMAEQQLHGIWREFLRRFAVAGGVAAQEIRGEQRDIGAPLAQRRESDLDRVETKQQILAEAPGFHLGLDVGVGGCDDAYVRTPRARGAYALVLAGLEHAQQLRLLRHRQIRDLVEEQRAALGELEATDAIRLRVGERATHMPE